MITISIISIFILVMIAPEIKRANEDFQDNDWWTSTHCIILEGELIERFGYDICNSSKGIFRAEFGIPKEYIKEIYLNERIIEEPHWHILRL